MSDEDDQPAPSHDDAAAAARSEAAKYRRQVRELEAKLAAVQTEHDSALKAAVKAARDDVLGDAEAKVAAANRSKRILSNAIGKVVDPAAAEKLLDLDALGTDPSDESIGKALDELVAQKGYLRPGGGLGKDNGSGVRESVQTEAKSNSWFDEQRKAIR